MDEPRNEHLDEGTIHAWIDGALPADEATRVEVHAAECAACAAMVAEARGLVAASKRILAALDDVPSGVIPNSSPTTVESIRAAAAREDFDEGHRAVAAAAMGGASVELPRTREYHQAAVGSRSFARRYGPIAAVLACVAVGLSALQWFKPGNNSVVMDRISATASAPAPTAIAPGPNAAADERAALPRPGVAEPTPPAPSAATPMNQPANPITALRDAGAASENQKAKKADEEVGLRRAIGQTQATGRATSSAASGAGAGSAGRVASSPIIASIDSVNRLQSAKQLAAADKSADRKDVAVNTAAPRTLAETRQPAEIAPAAPPVRQRALAPVIVSGRVTDSVSGHAIPSALVYIRGTDIKTETNANGEYVLRVPLGPQPITASVSGYAQRSTVVDAVNDRAIVASFPLRPAPASLSGAVVNSVVLAERDGFAAAAPSIEGLTLKGSSTTTDTASVVRRTVFEVRPGVEVTLLETRPIAEGKEKLESQRAVSRAQKALRKEPAASPASVTVTDAAKRQNAAIHTVRWTLPDGRTMELSGPISVEELEALRKRLR